MGAALAAVAVAGACGAAAWATTVGVVPRLPEPGPSHPDADSKLPYAGLATPADQLAAVAAGAAAGLVAATAPLPAQPLLAVLAGPVAALVLVDLRTTWLPLPLTRLCWGLAALAGAGGCLLAADPPGMLARCAAGAAAAFALFWLVWRLGAGLGYGDVRLSPMLGAAAATVGWLQWQAWLLAGTLIGALWGLATALWRRRRPSSLGNAFAYGPALWLGLWAALLL